MLHVASQMLTRELEHKRLNTRKYLLEELERRCKKNSSYSLRAFAKTLKMSPGGLSLFLSGKRGIKRETAMKIAENLGLAPELRSAFLEGLPQKPDVQELSSDEGYYTQLSLDAFAVISDWHHYGILSLIETQGFQPRISWIAARLGITPSETMIAVERLKSLGLLDTSTNPWRQIGGPIKVENSSALSAAKSQQKQILEKAVESLENDPFELRDMCSMTMAIDPELIPLAREEIRKFRRYLTQLLESRGNQKEVYHLGVQIYPVSKAKVQS